MLRGEPVTREASAPLQSTLSFLLRDVARHCYIGCWSLRYTITLLRVEPDDTLTSICIHDS